MIPLSLLTATESRGVGIGIYGGAGLKKTHASCTLPPPILHLDVGEGGTGSLLPWIRRRRNYDQSTWTTYSDDDRTTFLNLLDEDTRRTLPLQPAPLIDVIHYDNTEYDAYAAFSFDITSLDSNSIYNSLALDSLQEFAIVPQTFVKGEGNYMSLVNEKNLGWIGAQERAAIFLRKIRNLRDKGMFIYMVGSEDIAKDYVRNPLAKRERGAPEPEAYSIRGTVDLPGKLATGLTHIPDILCHVRLLNNKPTWVTEPEPLPGGEAWWDAKDRYGRLAKYEGANVMGICQKLYGVDGFKKLYGYCLGQVKA